jgi:hypothetical protein
MLLIIYHGHEQKTCGSYLGPTSIYSREVLVLVFMKLRCKGVKLSPSYKA